jgi:hypothetical protein
MYQNITELNPPWQGKARQGKARQGKARQGKAELLPIGDVVTANSLGNRRAGVASFGGIPRSKFKRRDSGKGLA